MPSISHCSVRYVALAFAGAVFVATFPSRSSVQAADLAAVKLPAPLDAVELDLGLLAKDFEAVKIDHRPPGEFTVPPNRVVEEDTLIFTLKARRDVGKREMNGLLANPFPRVRFEKLEDGKSTEADARANGYGLYHDGRWLSRDRGPDLKAGEEIQVWTHLGSDGAKALREKNATKARIEKPEGEAKK